MKTQKQKKKKKYWFEPFLDRESQKFKEKEFFNYIVKNLPKNEAELDTLSNQENDLYKILTLMGWK